MHPTSESNTFCFLRKIEARGGHPNIIKIFDAFEDSKNVRLVMEYFPEDLFRVVQEEGNFSEALARYYFKKILAAVRFLHENGIAHLDLSLENILVGKGRLDLKLCDFGASREVKRGEFLKNV